jgi:hypothetical protein
MRKIILCIITAVVVTGCGGGSDSEQNISTTAPQTNTVAKVPDVYYEEIKNAIPSLSLYYDKTCGKDANSFVLPSIDANNDGLNDLFIFLWCGVPEYGKVYEGPSINTLIGLLQNNDGTFRLGNQELFGKHFVELTGVVAERADMGVGDFNGDGRRDIAFVPVLEDGRQLTYDSNGASSWDTNPAVLLSQPNGQYAVEVVGPKGMYESLAVVNGKAKDTFAAGGYLFSYENNKWNLVTLNFPADRTLHVSGNFATMNFFDGRRFGYQAGNLDANLNFTQTQYLHISDLQKVPVYNNTQMGGKPSEEYLVTIDNKDYVLPAFNTVCVIPDKNNNDYFIMAQFEAIALTERYVGQRLEWNTPGPGEVSGANGISRVFTYKVSKEKIEKINLSVFDKNFKNVHYFDCVDIDGDGNIDLSVYIWGMSQEKSFIFLNDGENFKEVSQDKLPNISKIYHGHTTLKTDLNKDKQAEVIYGPGLGYKKDYVGLYDDYQVFRSMNKLK